MLRNYLKIGLRNLSKNKLFSLINISGMAISIASVLIISLFIYDEFQFDQHVAEKELKYRVYTERYSDDGQHSKQAMISPMIAPTLHAEYPEVESYVRFMFINSNVLFEVGETKITEEGGAYADPTVFEMFSLNLSEGDIKTALREPYTVAISKTLAEKYFGKETALGRSIEIANDQFIVTAVYEDFRPHSHLQLNYFLPMELLVREIPQRMQSWGWQQFHTYIKLKPGTTSDVLESRLKGFAERNAWPVTKPSGSYYVPHLMPLEKVHLHSSDLAWDIAVRGSAQTIYILSVTAIFILIIAILNFVNLSTARAMSRMKEVGVRKVVGAIRTQLIYQFISESVIITFIALLLAGLLTELSIPALNVFAGKNIPAGIFLNPYTIVMILAFALLVGVAAGAYPAFHISGYRPAHILTNRQSPRSGSTMFRKGLVVFQFVLSFFLIIAALVISDQHRYMRTMDMGFEKENLVVIPLRGRMSRELEATKNTFLDHPNAINATCAYGLPGQAYAGDGVTDKATNKDWPISMLPVDHDYVRTLGLQLIAGRDFSEEFPSDTSDAFIISEAAAKMFGYSDPRDAINHELSWTRWDNPDTKKEGKVIGVVKDFHLNSLKENLTPVMMHIYPFGYESIAVRVKSENISETIMHFEKSWKQFNSEWPFEYKFLDDNFDRLYKSEEKLANLFTFFTAFAIFVACLGLFGLVTYSTTQRYREISIRKVLGAEETSLVFQLSKSYMALISIAFVVAIPISFYAARQWLLKFAYRIEITPGVFIKAGMFILAVSLLTVGIQSLIAARGNPVDALKEQ